MMLMAKNAISLFFTILCFILISDAQMAPAVEIETVVVGNFGNPGELSGEGAGGSGPDRICGAVNYTYAIAKHEITAGQYVEFLNAVAATDTYELYNIWMWEFLNGCKIQRNGASGDYVYSIAPDWTERPVNYVSWGDAARFANWMHNGQPTGEQDLNTTEDGSYLLNGAMTKPELMMARRRPGVTWVIPSEDEWYKAAYHKNDGVTANYFDYAPGGYTLPENEVIDPDPGYNANVAHGTKLAIGSPYYRTVVEEYENSESAYGTFDQTGNVWEWTEGIVSPDFRVIRQGSYGVVMFDNRRAQDRSYNPPTSHSSHQGFRLADVSGVTAVPAMSRLGVIITGLAIALASLLVIVRKKKAGRSFREWSNGRK